MPVPTSCEEFLDLVRESGLVEEAVLGPFLEKNRLTETRALAEEMAKAGLITRFQMALLLQGMKRGFFIGDKWMVLDQLGAGGMGKVFLCRHKVMRHEVAIKVLPSSFAKNREYVDRFMREARAAAALNHPNIVRAFDVDQDDRVYYLVMEYVDGCNLQDLVDDKGPLGIKTATSYIVQAATGLQAAHEAGLVHRDIKPGNLLVDRNRTVKVLDLGLAMFFQEQGKGVTQQYDANAILGTAEYLAPEQAVNSQGVDIRADIYSLGMTFYFLLTAKSPYGEAGSIAQKLLWHQMRTPKSVREIRPEVPEEIAAVVDKMLAKTPAERYQTPADVVRALASFAGGAAAEPTTIRTRRGDGNPGVSGTAPTMLSSRDETLTEQAKQPSSDKPRSDPENKRGPDEDRPAQKKKPRSDRPVVEHDDDDEDEDEREDRPRRRKGRSGKHKKSAGFFTPVTILLCAGGGLVVLALAGVLIWVAMSGSSHKTPLAQNPPPDAGKKGIDQKPPDVTPPVKGPDPTPLKKPEPKKDPPPMVKPPEPKKEPPPTVKPPEPKKENPPEKKADPVKNAEPKKVPDPKQESLADYYPKAGQTLTYDIAYYSPTAPSPKNGIMRREKWAFKQDKDKGTIEQTLVKIGAINGDLFQGGKVDWKGTGGARAQAFFRTASGHIEYSPGGDLWEPILPLKAAVKESWKMNIPSGGDKTFTVEKLDTFKGDKAYKGSHPAVVIRAAVPLPSGGEMVVVTTYAKGIGEVSRRQTLEMNGKSQVLLEAKIVDE